VGITTTTTRIINPGITLPPIPAGPGGFRHAGAALVLPAQAEPCVPFAPGDPGAGGSGGALLPPTELAGSTLPATGAPAGPLLALAGTLVAAGWALLTLRRRA
jgi:LPXTG-motif cell wall-anchored protein